MRDVTPESVVRAWNDAYSAQDVETALSYMSDDFFRVGDCTRWVPIGKGQWAEDQKGFFEAFPDWSWDLTNLVTVGDTVVCEFLEHGTFTRPYTDINRIVGNFVGRKVTGLTLEPDGQSYEDYNCDWFRVNDQGLITELRAYITNNLDRTFHFEGRILELTGRISEPQNVI